MILCTILLKSWKCSVCFMGMEWLLPHTPKAKRKNIYILTHCPIIFCSHVIPLGVKISVLSVSCVSTLPGSMIDCGCILMKGGAPVGGGGGAVQGCSMVWSVYMDPYPNVSLDKNVILGNSCGCNTPLSEEGLVA